jgi:hypothetical protein
MYDWREMAAGLPPAANVKKITPHIDTLPDSNGRPNTGMAARFLSMLDPKAQKFTFQVFHDKNKTPPQKSSTAL